MASSARARLAATTTGAALVALLAAAPAGASRPSTASAPSAGPVSRIYVSLPRQGAAAPSAALIARGLRIATAVREHRAGGRRIRLVWLDDATGDRWDAAKVVANARRAAADPTAIAYVGEGNSEATALAMPIVNRAGLAHLSPVSSAAGLSAPDRAAELQPTGTQTFFRPVPDDARQGGALVTYARSSGVRGRVLLVDDDGLYGRGLTTAFAADAGSRGVGVLGRRVVAPGTDLGALRRELRTLRPRAVVYGGAPSSGAAAVVRAVHAASPDTLILAGDALANDAFAKDAGAAQSVLRLTTPAAHADPRAARTHGLGRRPAPFTVFAHNGMTALLRAVDRAGRTGAVTRERVRSAVFDGTVQRGLSGAWTLTAAGDSTYGVYDELRLAGGRVRTPGDAAVDRLVRRESAALRARLAGRRAARTTAVPMTAQASVATGLTSTNIASMDLETAMMAVQAQRTSLLDAQLREQVAAVQTRTDRLGKLQALQGALSALRAIFPAGAPASQSTGWSFDPAMPGAHAAVSRAASTAGVTGLVTTTIGGLDAARATVAQLVDAESDSQQMDMLRLQSLTNKRNEAFDAMTNFLKKMQESRAAILGAMR